MYLSTMRSPSSTHPLQLQFLAQFEQKALRIFSAFPVFVWTLLFHPVLTTMVLSLHRKPPADGCLYPFQSSSLSPRWEVEVQELVS